MPQHPSHDPREQAVSKTEALLALAVEAYSRTMPSVDIRFDLRGQAAGMVRFKSETPPLIRYNHQLLRENFEAFLAQTVPHETAHVVAHTLFGTGIRPHGSEWKSVMELFGAEGGYCHRYDTRNVRIRKLRLFGYVCGCRSHQLTAIRHNRIAEGRRRYYCRHCGEPLRHGG